MVNLSWLAEIIFFGSYFVAWAVNQLPHVLWITVSAIAALVVAVLLLIFNGYSYTNRTPPQA